MSRLLLPLTRVLGRSRRGERGQLVILVAGAMVVVIGFAALAVDIGFFTHTKREAQNDADAVALAAVRELPQSQTLAETMAIEWADNNDVTASERAASDWLTFGDRCSGDAVPANLNTTTVRLIRNQATFFANIFGISDGDLNVCATAAKGKAVGGPDLLPFALLWDKWTDDPALPGEDPPPVCFFDEDPYEETADPEDPQNWQSPSLVENPDFWYDPDNPTLSECRLVISPNNTWASGNSGPLRLDDNQDHPGNWRPNCDTDQSNNGDDEYDENIQDGSECGYGIGDWVKTKPGNVPKTCEELNIKFGGSVGDTIDDVYTDTDGDGVYDLVDTSNPHYGLVPIVFVPPGSGGTSDVLIRGFVPVFLHECSKQGNDSVITLTPVKATIYVAGIEFVEASEEANLPVDWPLHTIKLID